MECNNCLGTKGRGGGQVVSVLALYSDDPSTNPAEVCNFSKKFLQKVYKNRLVWSHLKKLTRYHSLIEAIKHQGFSK